MYICTFFCHIILSAIQSMVISPHCSMCMGPNMYACNGHKAYHRSFTIAI